MDSFTLISFVQEVQVSLNEISRRVSAKPLHIYRSMNFVLPIFTFRTRVKMLGDQLELGFSVK